MAYSASPIANTIWGGNGGITSSAVNNTGADILSTAAGYYTGGGSPSGFTDSLGNSWATLTPSTFSNQGSLFGYAKAPSVSSSQTFGVTLGFGTACAVSFSGSDQSAPFDVENGSATGGGAPVNSGSITPAANSLVLASICLPVSAGTGLTYSNGFAKTDEGQPVGGCFGNALAYKVITSSAATSTDFGAWSGSSASTAIASFKVASGGGGVSGSVAVTEGADVFVGAGSVLVSGTIAVTEGADVLAASGSVLVSGSIAVTELVDNFAATGNSGVAGSVAATELPDSITATGSFLELVDRIAITGSVPTSWTPVPPATGIWTPQTPASSIWTPQ